MVAATDGDNGESVTAFWKLCNIKNVIDIIKETWSDISKDGVYGGWWKLLQNYIRDNDLELSKKPSRIKELRAALESNLDLKQWRVRTLRSCLHRTVRTLLWLIYRNLVLRRK